MGQGSATSRQGVDFTLVSSEGVCASDPMGTSFAVLSVSAPLMAMA